MDTYSKDGWKHTRGAFYLLLSDVAPTVNREIVGHFDASQYILNDI